MFFIVHEASYAERARARDTERERARTCSHPHARIPLYLRLIGHAQHRNTLTVLVHHPADTACIHRHTLFHAACPPHPRTPTPPLAPFTCVQRGWGGTQNNTGIFCCKKGVQIVSMSPSSPNVQEKRAWTPVAPTRISNLLRPRSCMRTPSKPSRVCRYKNAVGIMIDAASDPRLLRCFGNTPVWDMARKTPMKRI